MKLPKKIILVFLILLASPVFADGQGKLFWPEELVVAFYLIIIAVLIALAIVFSSLYKMLYERTRKEKRKTVIWMVFCSLAFPLIFAAAISGMNFDNLFYSYSHKGLRASIFNKTLISLLIFIGFNLGYFITPKLQFGKQLIRSQSERIKAIFIQSVFWLLFCFLFYLSIRSDLIRLERRSSYRTEKSISLFSLTLPELPSLAHHQ